MSTVQADSGSGSRNFALLGDQPVGDPTNDLLDMKETAAGISEMLVSLRGAVPFVLAVDAGWGMGNGEEYAAAVARQEGFTWRVPDVDAAIAAALRAPALGRDAEYKRLHTDAIASSGPPRISHRSRGRGRAALAPLCPQHLKLQLLVLPVGLVGKLI